jgi:hypothetical protein
LGCDVIFRGCCLVGRKREREVFLTRGLKKQPSFRAAVARGPGEERVAVPVGEVYD